MKSARLFRADIKLAHGASSGWWETCANGLRCASRKHRLAASMPEILSRDSDSRHSLARRRLSQ